MALGDIILALFVIMLFSVILIQFVFGMLLFFLNQGFKIGRFTFTGFFREIRIPPLVTFTQIGMLIGGLVAINVLHDIAGEMDDIWSHEIRTLALTVILYRAGIGLDISTLRSKGAALIRLTVMPQVIEATCAGIIAKFLFDLSWPFALALGNLMGAVSPAVLVPSCITLRNEGYGVDKGIPSVLIAASSLDDVLAISMFGLFVGIGFGGEAGGHGLFGDTLLDSLLIGPIEILGGLVVGIVIGLAVRPLKNIHNLAKSILLFIICYAMVLIAELFGLTGLGFLASITCASTAGMKWGGEIVEDIENYVGYLWGFLQVPLFGLVGASAYFADMESETIWKAVLLSFLGLLFRVPAASLAMLKTELNWKEKLFVGIAWIPKATVQAALGGVVLGQAQALDDSEDLEDVGMIFLTVAVFSILITAPIGVILTAISGPKLLEKGEKPLVQV